MKHIIPLLSLSLGLLGITILASDTKLQSELLFTGKDAETWRHGNTEIDTTLQSQLLFNRKDTGIEKTRKEVQIASLNASWYEETRQDKTSPGFNLSQKNVLELPLEPIAKESQAASLGLDEQLWRMGEARGDRQQLLNAIDHSLRYLNTAKARQDYQNYLVPGITHRRVRRSLIRFRQLLLTSSTPEALQASVQQEFTFYQSVGGDGEGTVSFTGYFEPVYEGSRVQTPEYRYPLYGQPRNFATWSSPHPTRAQLEGVDGLLGEDSPLTGYELVWLRDRLEAFLIHVQGSAKVQLTNGQTMSVGYNGKTNHPYTSIGRALVDDGKLDLEGLTLPQVINYFRQNPAELDRYLPRNQSFVFFRETYGAPATGSLGVPVTANRSIATDKSLMPPGSLALIQTQIPTLNAGILETPLVSRYVLDQDTGSAIKTPGRVDIFMGTGSQAGDRAGAMNTTGTLYYLLLKE